MRCARLVGRGGLLGQRRLDGLSCTQHVRVLLDRDRWAPGRTPPRRDHRGPTIEFGLLAGDLPVQMCLGFGQPVRPPGDSAYHRLPGLGAF